MKTTGNYKSKHEKACRKRCVLRSVLKQLRSFTALIFDGNLFQSLGADATNDLSPKVLLVMVLGDNNCSSDWNRSIICPNCCLRKKDKKDRNTLIERDTCNNKP